MSSKNNNQKYENKMNKMINKRKERVNQEGNQKVKIEKKKLQEMIINRKVKRKNKQIHHH